MTGDLDLDLRLDSDTSDEDDGVDLLEMLHDLDATLVLVGAPGGARVAATVALDRRAILDDLLDGPPEGRRPAWLDLLDAIDALLPGELSLFALRPGQVVTMSIRAAMARVATS